jgi:hypothetical protein
MNFAVAARIVAATLALVAAIYTITTFLVKSKTEVYEKWGEKIEERIDALETEVYPDEKKVIIKKKDEK